MPSKISQFWQELKPRKVVRVITVYAASAFVILELVDIVAPSLGLPDWTLNLVLILLIVGFIITVIVSWIYDINPEGGVVKTEPARSVKEEDKHHSSKGWKIATYISFVVILGLIILNIISKSGKSKEPTILDKSIAVLPFTSLSDDPDKQYQADGVMDAILLHLCKISDLRVMSRTSVEQYRDTDKTIPDICEELGVAYILEGSFQQYEDQARLIVQLIQSGTEGHIWANNYDRNWKDIFSVQSEVAQAIASELNAVITPEEKQRIEKIPTTNLTAYDYYQKGEEERSKYSSDDSLALERAEDLYRYALDEDSTFALAYIGLAKVYYIKNYSKMYLSENFLDSVLILSDIALSYDDQLAEAYIVRGYCFNMRGLTTQAIEEYEKAIEINPNDYLAYQGLGTLYEYDDCVKSIAFRQKAVSLSPIANKPSRLRSLGRSYSMYGFTEKNKYYLQEALKLDGDSIRYYRRLSSMEFTHGTFEKAIDFAKKGIAIDSNNIDLLSILGRSYLYLGQYAESLKYYKRYYERIKASGRETDSKMHLIGYAYWQNGYKEESEYYFNEMINYCNRVIELGRHRGQTLSAYFYFAEVYAFKGEKDKAFENLRIFNQRQTMTQAMCLRIKNSPLLDNIRDDPEFQQIVHDAEAKYQAEHERVRQWLEENEML